MRCSSARSEAHSVAEHAYFTFMDERAEPWNPHDATDLPFAGAAYIAGYLRELERHWEGDPLTFYVTHHAMALPSYGRDVVVVLLNDEGYRTPAYSGCVLATLRTLPARPRCPGGAHSCRIAGGVCLPTEPTPAWWQREGARIALPRSCSGHAAGRR